MGDVCLKPARKAMLRVAAALQEELDAGSGLSRVQILAVEGKGRKPVPKRWSPRETLKRLLRWDDYVLAAEEFERRAEPSETFWTEWLSVAINAPSDFRSQSKLTAKMQVAAISSIVTASAHLQKKLEYALIVPSLDLSETEYLEQAAKLRGRLEGVRVPSLIDLQVSLPSALGKEKRLGIPSFTILLQNVIAALSEESITLTKIGDDAQLNKGNAPQRFLVQRLDVALRNHFDVQPKRSLKLLVATVNGVFDLSGNACLDQKAASDLRKYGRKKHGR